MSTEEIVETTAPATTTPIPEEHTVIVERLTGTVKWFNNKAGFGFITVCDQGVYHNMDIFVHYNSIRVSNSQYKYLVQGEYVDFTLIKASSVHNEGHEFQAMDVSGVKGGPIMCETRRITNNNHTSAGFQTGQGVRPPHRVYSGGKPPMTPRGPGPRRSLNDQADAGPSVEVMEDTGFVKVQRKRRSTGGAPK